MAVNLNNYESGAGFDLIPKGTKAKFYLELKPGGANIPGEDETGVLTQSKNGPTLQLVAVAHVVYGPYAKRQIFCRWTVGSVNGGTRPHEQNLQTAADISMRTLRGIVESARGIDPKDFSDRANQARFLQSFSELGGLEFAAEIGIEVSKDPSFDDKNDIRKPICLGHKDYQALMSGQYQPPAAQPGPGGGGNQWGQAGGSGTAQWSQGGQAGPQTGPPAGNQNQQGPVPPWTQDQPQQATQPPSQGAWGNGGQAQPGQQQEMFTGQPPAGGPNQWPPTQQQPGPAASHNTTKAAWAQ